MSAKGRRQPSPQDEVQPTKKVIVEAKTGGKKAVKKEPKKKPVESDIESIEESIDIKPHLEEEIPSPPLSIKNTKQEFIQLPKVYYDEISLKILEFATGDLFMLETMAVYMGQNKSKQTEEQKKKDDTLKLTLAKLWRPKGGSVMKLSSGLINMEQCNKLLEIPNIKKQVDNRLKNTLESELQESLNDDKKSESHSHRER